MALQRKRTERACDQCKRRKTKCNGLQNCDSCAAFGIDCSFGSPSKKARGPTYIAHLEQTVRELQSQIETNLLTNRGGDSPDSMERKEGDADHLETLAYPTEDVTASHRYGSCSGVEILRRMRVHLSRAVGSHPSKPAVDALTDALDRPLLELCVSPTSAFHVFSPLRADLLRYVDVAFEEAFWFRPFVDRDAVEAAISRVYDTGTAPAASCYAQDEMALIYAIAAIGAYLSTDAMSGSDYGEVEKGWKGIAYFQTARSLVDPSNCERSVPALQTVICMAIYLVVTSAITRAHMFIDIAVAGAVRLGLHNPLPCPNFAQCEEIQRKRTLRSIKVIKVYIATFLGLPCCLEGLEAGEWASEERKWASIAPSSKPNDVEVAVDACIEPFIILRNANQELYFSGSQPAPLGHGSVPSSLLRRYNAQLENWILSISNLDISWRSQLLVYQTAAYVQMMLNSQFLHYLTVPASARHNDGNGAALKCVAAAIQTIEVIQALNDKGLLNWAHSFTLRSLAFAAITLLTIEISGIEVPGMGSVIKASGLAENLLNSMAMRHFAALGCFQSLQSLYELKYSRQLALTMPELTFSSRTTSSWASPSTDNTEPCSSWQPVASSSGVEDPSMSFQEIINSF